MFFTKKKAKPPPQRKQQKVALSKSSGLDSFISEMKSTLRGCEKKNKKYLRVTAEHWRGMIDKIEAIKGKL